MKNLIKNAVYWAGILTLGVALGVTIKMVGAWVEPDQMPPGGNIAAPLNTGNVGQTKLGGLVLNTGGSAIGLIVEKGLVGIGTTTPQAELDVNGNIRAHNLNLNNNLNVGGTSYFGGNVNVNGDVYANRFIARNSNTNTTVEPGRICVGQYCITDQGFCIGTDCRNSWAATTTNTATRVTSTKWCERNIDYVTSYDEIQNKIPINPVCECKPGGTLTGWGIGAYAYYPGRVIPFQTDRGSEGECASACCKALISNYNLWASQNSY